MPFMQGEDGVCGSSTCGAATTKVACRSRRVSRVRGADEALTGDRLQSAGKRVIDVVVRYPAWAGDPAGYWLSNAVSRRVGRLSCLPLHAPKHPKKAGVNWPC